VQEVASAINRGDMDQCLLGLAGPSRQAEIDGAAVREVLEVDLDGGDVSVVTYAWYDQTSVSLKGLALTVGRTARRRQRHRILARALAAVDASTSFMATWDAVEEALCEHLAEVTGDPYAWAYVTDIGDDWAVYCAGGVDGLTMIAYTRDDAGTVTFGESTPVVGKVTYEPVAVADPTDRPVTASEPKGTPALACPSPWPAPTREAGRIPAAA